MSNGVAHWLLKIVSFLSLDLMNLWNIPQVGEVDEVKTRQLRLAKMIEGNYNEEEEMEESIVQEVPKQIDYEKELSLPPAKGDEGFIGIFTSLVPWHKVLKALLDQHCSPPPPRFIEMESQVSWLVIGSVLFRRMTVTKEGGS